MLPSYGRCDEQCASDRKGADRLFEIAGVPQHDGGHEQIEAGSAIGLVLEPLVVQFAELIEEERGRARRGLRPC